jgi:hypothetical protein
MRCGADSDQSSPQRAGRVLSLDGGAHILWVPNWSSTLCDLGVFVYQPVEQVATSDVRLGWRRR